MYVFNLYKNLYASISIPTEQLYLSIKGRFNLSKVSKLRCEMLGGKKIKNKVRELVLFQKTLITLYVHIQSLQKFICKYFNTYRTTLLRQQRSISFSRSIEITL